MYQYWCVTRIVHIIYTGRVKFGLPRYWSQATTLHLKSTWSFCLLVVEWVSVSHRRETALIKHPTQHMDSNNTKQIKTICIDHGPMILELLYQISLEPHTRSNSSGSTPPTRNVWMNNTAVSAKILKRRIEVPLQLGWKMMESLKVTKSKET